MEAAPWSAATLRVRGEPFLRARVRLLDGCHGLAQARDVAGDLVEPLLDRREPLSGGIDGGRGPAVLDPVE